MEEKKKDGKKTRKPFKIALVSTIGVLTLFGAFLSGYAIGHNAVLVKKDDVGDLNIKAVEGISIKQLRTIENKDGTFSKEVSYVLKPEGTQAEEFNTSLTWNKGDSSDYDWQYDENKKVEDYVTYSLDAQNQTILFTCKQAFGRQLDFFMCLSVDTEVKAAIILNYERKILQPASASISRTSFSDGQPISVSVVNSVYSTGTKGRKQDDVNMEVSYDASKVSFRSLFGECTNPSTYSAGIYEYQGVRYSGKDNFVNAMMPLVDNYMKSTIVLEGTENVNFTRKSLQDFTSFNYVMYHTFRDEYGKDSHITNDFIKNYKEAFKKGSGYRVKVTVNSKEVLNQLLDLDMNVNLVTGIQFQDSAIDF